MSEPPGAGTLTLKDGAGVAVGYSAKQTSSRGASPIGVAPAAVSFDIRTAAVTCALSPRYYEI